jgi:hypothetical protein
MVDGFAVVVRMAMAYSPTYWLRVKLRSFADGEAAKIRSNAPPTCAGFTQTSTVNAFAAAHAVATRVAAASETSRFAVGTESAPRVHVAASGVAMVSWSGGPASARSSTSVPAPSSKV